MVFEKTIYISKEEADQINKHLTVEPTCADECLGEDIAIVHTAKFNRKIEMDIKCCGVQYDERNESNLAWTEAVLLDDGHQVCYTEVYGDYIGEWICEYEGNEYIVHVEIGG